jgi:glycosyltransferase involved in cell wall biosynthesis
MRIAQLAPPWFSVPPAQYGGIELVVSLLTDGLVERGHDVTLFATGDSKTKAKLEVVFEEALGLDYMFSIQHELLHAEPLVRRSREFDLIHAHSSIALFLTALTERPLVTTLHGGKKLRPVFSLLGTRAWFVAPSTSFHSALPGLHYAGVIPYGIDVRSYDFRVEKGDFVLFMGRAVPQKGLHLAIGAARAAGLPLIAVAVRRGLESERSYWEQKVKPLLGADVTIIDEVGFDDKVDLMSRARALLFPIDWDEPFGLVVVESMACGTPVVATRRASTPELIQPGKTGFLFPIEGYVAGAGEVLSGALDSIEAQDCRSWVEERFSKERMVLDYEKAYERILSGQPWPSPPGPGSGR